MSSLTDTLDSPTRGKSIIEPAQQSGGFISGLADLASNLTKAGAQNYSQGRAIGQTKVENELVSNITALQQQATAAIRSPQSTNIDPSIDPEHVLPPDVVNQANDVLRTKKAVDQGRQASAAYDLGVENLISTMNAKYPEYTAVIYDYLHNRGIDHAAFRELKAQQLEADAGAQARAEGYKAVIDKAMKSGVNVAGLTEPQIYDIGAKLLGDEYNLKLQKDRLDALKANQEVIQGQQNIDKANEAQNQSLIYKTVTSAADTHMLSLMHSINNFATLAADDEEKNNIFQKSAAQITDAVKNYRLKTINEARASGASADTVAQINTTFDNYEKDLHDAFLGENTRFAQTHRSYLNMQDQLGIEAERALPVFSMLKRQFGGAALDMVFNGDPSLALSDDLKKRIQTDIRNFDPTKPNTGLAVTQDIGALIRGDKSWDQIPESAVTVDHIKGLAAGIAGARARILDPAPDSPEDHKTFLSSYGNLTLSGQAIQPGYKNVDGLKWMTNHLYSDANVAMLTKEMKDPQFATQAQATFRLGRATAARLLDVSQTAANSLGIEGQKIIYKNGRYVVDVKPNPVGGSSPGVNALAGLAFGEANPGGYIHGVNQANKPNSKLVDLADTMNRQLDYLVNTRQADPETASVNPNLLREHYVNGTPLPKKEGEVKGPDFKQQLDQLQNEVAAFNTDISKYKPQTYDANKAQLEPIVNKYAAKHGFSTTFAHGLVQAESSWDPNADAHKNFPKSHAGGLFQVQPGTMELMGFKGDQRFDPDANSDAGLGYLAKLREKHGGDIRAALREYSGNSYDKSTLDHLVQLYEG